MIKFGDKYSRQARLYPGLIVLTPILSLVIALFPGLLTEEIGKILLTILFSIGALYFLASISRTAGKNTERRLLGIWGAWPTTIWLRHSDANLVPQTKMRYHDYLDQNVPGISLPTAEQENEDPAGADQVYASAVDWLKEHRRDDQYSLLLDENIQYGFRRNMRGMKSLAIILSVISILIICSMIFYKYGVGTNAIENVNTYKGLIDALANLLTVPVGAALGLNIIAMFFWLFYVRDIWVREAADQYARALLSTCE
ncbi:MAG: hypothetical protein ABW152_16645 [Candidatus Thiodiazotropha endolucinida]